MVEFELHGLTPRQCALADIMWSLEEWSDIEAFIKTLPKADARECRNIIELMKMAIIEQCYDGIQDFEAAKAVINRVK